MPVTVVSMSGRDDFRALGLHLACIRGVTETKVHLYHAFFGDGISSGAARDQPDIRRNTAPRIVQPIDRKHDLRHSNDSVAALVRITAGVRRPASGADNEDADPLTLGHDLAAVTRRLGDEHVTLAARSRSMTRRETGLLNSSSGVNRKVIGNFVRRLACAIRRNASTASMSPPFIS